MNKNTIEKEEFEVEGENFDLSNFYGKLVNKWWVYLISLIVWGALCVAYLKLAPPAFNITSYIMLNDTKDESSPATQVLSSLSNFSDIFDVQSNTDNELTVLQTKAIVRDVVRAMHLDVTYYQTGFFDTFLIGYSQLYRSPFKVTKVKMNDTVWNTTFDMKVDSKKNISLYYTSKYYGGTLKNLQFDKPFVVPGVGTISISTSVKDYSIFNNGYSFTVLSVDEQAYDLQQNIAPTIPDDKSTAISVTLSYPISKRGEEILDTMFNIYMTQNLAEQNEIADSTIAFINTRLVVVSKELGKVEGSIELFKQKNSLADIPEQSKLMVDVGGTYTQQLIQLETQLNVLNTIFSYLNDNSGKRRIIPTLVANDDPVYAGQISDYNSLLLERDRELLTSTSKNPYIKNLDDRIEALRNDMLSTLANSKKSLLVRKADLQKSNSNINSQINTAPVVQRLFLDMERQQNIQQALYQFLLQKREETELARTSTISSIRVIDPPKADFLPYSPKTGLSVILAGFMALFLPTVWFFASEKLNTKITTRDDIIKNVGVPIIGEISHSKTGNAIVVDAEKRTSVVEQFRALRTNLPFFLTPKPGNTILVTSNMSGEGKSFVALNLAMILAIADKKVLLMEMDLRRPNLTAKMNMENEFGFTNYIISPDVKIKDLIVPTKVSTNLFLISSGPIPPNPAEMLLNPKLDALMEEMKKEFDYIVIDAPPIGLVADAQLMNKFSDLSLFLVRQKMTHKKQLKLINDLHRDDKLSNMAIVVNDIAIPKGYGYSYGYGYGGYSYGQGGYGDSSYYHADEKTRKNPLKKLFRKK